MTREEWEAKFGGGRKIKWLGSESLMFVKWVCDDKLLASDGNYYYAMVNSDGCGWKVVREPEPTIEEKSIEDYPLAELRYGNRWFIRRYVLTYPDGGVLDTIGNIWEEMRPIKPVNTEDMKRKARLV